MENSSPQLPTIHSASLLLRPLKKGDLPLKVKWFNDPDIAKTLILEEPLELKKTIQWFDKIQGNPTRVDWLIEDKNGGPIGLLSFVGIDKDQKSAEIFIVIGEKEYWGRGVMLEAEAAAINWAFNDFGLEKIWAQARAENIASIITMKKLGFKMDKSLMKTQLVQGQKVDILHFDLLRQDFKFAHAN